MIGRRWFPIGIALLLPVLGLGLLVARPELDLLWEHHPSHFWLVLGTSAVSVVLAYLTNEAASRHADARIFLVSLAFLAERRLPRASMRWRRPARSFPSRTPGSSIATPVGLILAALFAAASVSPFAGPHAGLVLRHRRLLRWA